MHLHPEDPRLTAYVLDELEPEEAAAVEHAVATDPALRAEVQKIRQSRDFITENLTTSAEKLLPTQRETILQTASGQKILPIPSLSERLQAWIIPTAAAAVLAVATIILFLTPGAQEPTVAQAELTPSVEIPTPPELANPTRPAAASPSFSHRGTVSAKECPTLELPLHASPPSLPALSKSIRIDRTRPPRESIHLEEILNSFTYRLSGTTAIARGAASPWHPDVRENGPTAPLATLSTEMIACPWKPSSTLLFISLRNGTQASPSGALKVTYQANPENVFRYHLLGFTTAADPQPAGKSAPPLAASSVVTLAIEIEPSKPGTDLGSLVWSVGGSAAPEIHLLHRTDAAPSDDARLAALICTYAQWLSREQPGMIDADLVSAFTREITSPSLSPERADFLRLIEQSLDL